MLEQSKHSGMALDALEPDCIPSSAATVILKVISNIQNIHVLSMSQIIYFVGWHSNIHFDME